MVQLDALQPITVTAYKEDGTPIPMKSVTLTATARTGEFGTINDDGTIFNPGNSGTTGTIRGEADGLVGEVDVEVRSGALGHLKLVLGPVGDARFLADGKSLPTTPGIDNRPADPPHTSQYQMSNVIRDANAGAMDLPTNYESKVETDAVAKTVNANLEAIQKAGGTGEYVVAKGENPSAALTNSHAGDIGTKTVVAPVGEDTVVSTSNPAAKDTNDPYRLEDTHGTPNGGTPDVTPVLKNMPTVSESHAVDPKDELEASTEKVPVSTPTPVDEDDDEEETPRSRKRK